MPGSSPEDNLAETEVSGTAATETADVKSTPAESSPAEQKGEKGDILADVKSALKSLKEKSPASDEPGSESEDGEAEGGDKDAPQAESETDGFNEEELAQLAKLKPKTHKRITTLLEQQKGHLQELDALRQPAEQFEKIVTFVKDAGLSTNEMNDGFDVMRNLKRNPLKAYEQIKPIYEKLQQMVGDRLPEDLQMEVVSGRITEAHARELVRARTNSTLADRQRQEDDQRQQTEREQSAFNDRRQGAASSVTEWEKSKSKNDPDWKLKQGRVTELIELELHRKQRTDPSFFPNPQEAVAMADEALKRVNTEMRQFAPTRKAITPVTDVASTRATPKATTAVEAAKLALAKAG